MVGIEGVGAEEGGGERWGAMGPFTRIQPGEGGIRRNLIDKKVCFVLKTSTV